MMNMQINRNRHIPRFSFGGIFVAASLCALPLASNAAISTYYVSTSGSDTNDGKSWETAFATPNKGFSTINSEANRGSTLIIDSGKYALASAIGCTGGSSEANRSIVKSRTGNPNDVIFDAQGTHEGLRLASYITVSGITVSNGVNTVDGTKCPAAGIRFANTSGSEDYEIIVSNCVVTCCTNVFPDGMHGAAVDILGHNLLVDSVVRNNSSLHANGAGVIIVNRTDVKGPPKMLRCRIEGNSSAKAGGGVYISANNNADTGKSGGRTMVEIEDCEIIGNTSVNIGAGVYMPGYHETKMTRCRIANNKVVTSGVNGGGLRFEKGSVTMVDCVVEGNEAGAGAGVDIVPTAKSPDPAIATLVCTKTIFRGNEANAAGGAVRIYQYGRAFFDDCKFEGNKTTETTASEQTGGGGVWLSHQGSDANMPYGYCSVSNCVFGGNISGTRAGGLGGTWNTNFCGVVVNTILTNNQSRFQGGGLCIRESKANPNPAIIRNCLFAFNETTYDGTQSDSNGGGVLLVTKSNIIMENCTIVSNNIRNTGNYKSGGIHQRWGGTLKNCIVAFNTKCGQPEDTAYWNNDSTAANYINCCSDRAITKFTEANGCVAADPKFVDAAHGDFALQMSSPCVDKGANDGWMTTAKDLVGHKRIIGDFVDIGCYEYKPIPGMMLMLY